MLRLEESRITQLLKETIRVICRSADSCSEIAVQGLLGITLDRKEIFLVKIDDVIDMALERTGIAFRASVSNSSLGPQLSHGLLSQAAEQLQSRNDLNLNTGSADGRTVHDSTYPKVRLTRQRWSNSSVADSDNNSSLRAQGQKGDKVKTKGNGSLSCHSDVLVPRDCSTPTVLAHDVAASGTMSTRALTCVSNSGNGKGSGLGRGRGQCGKGRRLLGRGRGQCGKGRGLLGRGREQYGIGRGLLGRGRGQCGKGGELLGRGRGQCGRGRGYRGRGRGKQLVISSYRNKDMSLSMKGISGVPFPGDAKMRTRNSFISETHSTIISTVNNYSQHLENLRGLNESPTVSSVQKAGHKTLKTLKQPAFKRKLKSFGVITSKKSKQSNCLADSGLVIMQSQVSSSEKPLNRCSVCKCGFSKLTDLADHYTREHSTNSSEIHSELKIAQVETPEPVRCVNPSCGRTFPTQRGMLQHCGKIHNKFTNQRPGWGQLKGASSGTLRNGLRFSTHGYVDEKPEVGGVVGQIIPSLTFAFESGMHTSVQSHSLPHSITRNEFSDAESDYHVERDNVTPPSSLTIVKEETDATVYTDHME